MVRVRSTLLLLGLGLAGCGSRRGSGGPGDGVLLIVVDALRADHLRCYGYDRETDPNLDELAAEGVRFDQVFASAPQLIPAHAAILSGCEPILTGRFLGAEFQGANERRWHLPQRLPRLAVEFLAAGYETAAFLDHPSLEGSHGLDRGFQTYEYLDIAEREEWQGSQTKRVVDRFLQWVRTLPSGQRWFAYVHLNQLDRFWSEPPTVADSAFEARPELSQVPPVANTDSVFFAVPRSRWRGGARSLGQYEVAYDDEIRRVDAELGYLFASLRQTGRWDSTSIHVVGSYGMQFGEAGMFFTAGRYSSADLRVPWIMRQRKDSGSPTGTQSDHLVSTLDIAPTLADLEGMAARRFQGRSQAAVIRGEPDTDDRQVVFASCGVQEICAVIGARYALEYLIPLGTGDAQLRRSWTGTWSQMAMQPQLVFYDRLQTSYPPLAGDDQAERPPEFATLRSAALEWLRDMNDVHSYLQSPDSLDPVDLERLVAKGYVPPKELER